MRDWATRCEWSLAGQDPLQSVYRSLAFLPITSNPRNSSFRSQDSHAARWQQRCPTRNTRTMRVQAGGPPDPSSATPCLEESHANHVCTLPKPNLPATRRSSVLAQASTCPAPLRYQPLVLPFCTISLVCMTSTFVSGSRGM